MVGLEPKGAVERAIRYVRDSFWAARLRRRRIGRASDRAKHLPRRSAGRPLRALPTASKLLTDLHRQTPEGRVRKLRTYANVALLCIDEVGYLSFDDKSADLLYEVINQRYEQKSLVLATNRPFKEWNEVFPNAA